MPKKTHVKNAPKKKVIYDYIVEQFSNSTVSIDTIFTNSQNDVSVLRIATSKYNIYVTLGASFCQINNTRKDMTRFEIIMMASKSITEEQENAIVEQLSHFLVGIKSTDESLGELHSIDWQTEINANCFQYSSFMLLQAMAPLETNKKTIQFLICLPLFKDEIDWIDELQNQALLINKNFGQVSRKYTGCFLSCYCQKFFDAKYFCLDKPRNYACLNLKDNYQLSSIGDNCKNVAWGTTLNLSRKLGNLPFEPHRVISKPKRTKTNLNNNWKYEETKQGVVLNRYIGYELEITVPNVINNKNVVNISIGAFSPEHCKRFAFSKANENLMTLKKVVLPKSITTIEPELFKGCSCLEEVVFYENIKRIGYRAFSNCDSIKTNKYNNGLYLGIEGNPYYALIRIVPNVTYVTIHPNTKVIQQDAFVNNNNNKKLRLVNVPESAKDYFNTTISACNFKVEYY